MRSLTFTHDQSVSHQRNCLNATYVSLAVLQRNPADQTKQKWKTPWAWFAMFQRCTRRASAVRHMPMIAQPGSAWRTLRRTSNNRANLFERDISNFACLMHWLTSRFSIAC